MAEIKPVVNQIAVNPVHYNPSEVDALTELGILEQNGVITRTRCVLERTPHFALGKYQLLTIPDGDEGDEGDED